MYNNPLLNRWMILQPILVNFYISVFVGCFLVVRTWFVSLFLIYCILHQYNSRNKYKSFKISLVQSSALFRTTWDDISTSLCFTHGCVCPSHCELNHLSLELILTKWSTLQGSKEVWLIRRFSELLFVSGEWVNSSKRRDRRGFPKASRAAPRDFQRAKPKGNPKEQPCQPKENAVRIFHLDLHSIWNRTFWWYLLF